MKKVDLMNRDSTGKLQVTLTSKASSEEVIVKHSEKMKAKYMKEDA